MFSPTRLSLCGAILLLSSGFNGLSAQQLPTTPTPTNLTTPAQQEFSVRVEATTVKDELRLQVELRNIDVVKAIEEIANKGRLQVIVKGEVAGPLRLLSLQNATAGMALQKLCDVANLKCEVKDNVWVISPMDADFGKGNKPFGNHNKPEINSLAFKDVKVVDLLSLISAQFDVAIAIGGDVDGKIVFIKLENKTPRQAIELVALAAELKLEEAQDGTFIVSKPKKPLQLPPIQPPALQPPAPQPATPEESFGTRQPGFMLLSP